MEKTITLAFSNYVVKGLADVTHWGGGNACIEMDPFNINSIKDEDLLKNLNDGGFRVESINGAICDIFENYEGTLQFLRTKRVGRVSSHTVEAHEQIF